MFFRVVVSIIVVCIAIVVISDGPSLSPEERQVKEQERETDREARRATRAAEKDEKARRLAAEQKEHRHSGFHCLSGWNGAHSKLLRHFRANGIKDPDSFEHIRTTITPNENGWHRLRMDFRARNSFGGMVVGTVKANVNHATCSAVITDVLQ